jgi:hypothetical protein
MVRKNRSTNKHEKFKVDRIVEWITAGREMGMAPCAAIQWIKLTLNLRLCYHGYNNFRHEIVSIITSPLSLTESKLGVSRTVRLTFNIQPTHFIRGLWARFVRFTFSLVIKFH